jgi:hypothetical protein
MTHLPEWVEVQEAGDDPDDSNEETDTHRGSEGYEKESTEHGTGTNEWTFMSTTSKGH